MKKILLTIQVCLSSTLFAQIEYKDVAGIFYSRCTSCHHTGNTSVPFTGYSETVAYAASIESNLNSGAMPPWNADTSYTRFQHERIITATEKQKILDWIANGTPAGDTTLAPAVPVYNDGFQLAGTADLTLSIGTFTSTATSTDKYYCFSLPSGLLQDRIIKAFEIVPGNPAIVHHAVVTADTTGAYVSNLSGGCYNIPGNLSIGTYAPGTKATVFPAQAPLKAGITLKAGSKVIIQLHYPAGSAGQVDSTKIRLYFYPVGTTGVRRIYSATPLQNWSMSIPANTTPAFSAYYPSASTSLTTSLSAFAVMPHSHLLCTSIIYYAVNPGVDTIKLIHISRWNFEWQDYYTFRNLVKIPAGYKLYSKHYFDNTTNNPNNPNDPPINVTAGTGTNDEMLFDGMMYLYYQPGDELIDIESIINSDPLVSLEAIGNSSEFIKSRGVYPNPFSDQITLSYLLKDRAIVSIEIVDLVGKQVKQMNLGELNEGYNDWDWDGTDSRGNSVATGIYFYRIKANNYTLEGKIIKQK